MTDVREAATTFLANRRIAVTGVSRNASTHAANAIADRLRERGYEVFSVNPNASEVDGHPCWPDLASIPDGVEAVVISTRPEAARGTVEECIELGIHHVWMHRAFGAGSVSDEAVGLGRQHGLQVIDGGCPLMFEPTSDGGHRFMRRVLTWTGKVPKTV